jgi:putative ABC transport system permease protein
MPNWNHIVRQHLAVLRLPPEREIEIVEEQALHLEAAYEDALADGLSAAEAEARAVQSYDWRLLECELSRAERAPAERWEPVETTANGGMQMTDLIQDVRYGLRMLVKQPGFTFAALLALAFGIGANTAIFSVVNAVLLKSLPYENPNQLMMVWESNRELAKDHENPSPGNFLDLREQKAVFDSITAWFETARTLQGEHDAEQVNSAQVSVEFFQTLGAKAALGRVFQPGETTGVAHSGPGQYASGDRVIVISDSLWRRRFGADPALIGKPVTINGLDWQVLGVMPAGFAMPDQRIDLWEPWGIERSYGTPRFPEGPPRDWRFLSVLARLKSGITAEQAQAHLDSLSTTLAERHPKTNRGWRLNVTAFHDEVVGAACPPLLWLFAAVGMVLLIACANVAGLLMARAAGRQREIAVRSALGASRLRLMRQLLTESVILALLGGALGLALTGAFLDLLVSLAPADVPRIDQIAVDGRVLAFTMIVSVVTGIIFGLFPALKGSRIELTSALKEGGAGGGLSHHRFLKTMIVAEIAIALALMAGAGLLTRSFMRLLQADPGFDPKNLLTMHITLDGVAYRGRATEYYRQLIARLEALPGVVSAAAVTTLPMSDVGVDFDRPYWREGDPEPGGEGDKVDVRMATPGYFKTMGMALLKGRQFTDQDRRDTPAVIIVNESLANKVWPNEDPVGKRLMIDYNRGKYAYEVVGVTRGVSYYGLRSRPQPELFIPHAQNAYLPMNVVVCTTTDPAQLINAVKGELLALDPKQPAHNLVTMEQFIARSLAPDRFATWLLGLLSALALLLAATGVYGVMSYALNQRAREFAIRTALGAQARDIRRLALTHVLRLWLAGSALGLMAAWPVGRALQSQLYGVGGADAVSLLAALSFLLVTALVEPFRNFPPCSLNGKIGI